MIYIRQKQQQQKIQKQQKSKPYLAKIKSIGFFFRSSLLFTLNLPLEQQLKNKGHLILIVHIFFSFDTII